jgi:hypothetical protein
MAEILGKADQTPPSACPVGLPGKKAWCRRPAIGEAPTPITGNKTSRPPPAAARPARKVAAPLKLIMKRDAAIYEPWNYFRLTARVKAPTEVTRKKRQLTRRSKENRLRPPGYLSRQRTQPYSHRTIVAGRVLKSRRRRKRQGNGDYRPAEAQTDGCAP